MAAPWVADDILGAVNSVLRRGRRSFEFVRAELGDRAVLVVFSLPERRRQYGVYYSLAALPNGPMTGEVCDSPDGWAAEIGWDLDELIEAGGWDRAEHLPGPNDLVFLRWWGGDSIARC